MRTAEVDFTIEPGEDAAQVLVAMADGLGLDTKVLTERGPAGGNPLGQIEGSLEAVEAFLRQHGYDLEAYGISAS